ncbi:hypothetical protein PENTCL1PPCAC_17824 [Pristionchus entomophagus]|uniref:GRAM domain-containing protein n=1 Tax=Pristionchus entomophagus TaxID=358040 RepID=A0AAV5TNM1_9BILA|nr:hypothetical protein PENTCL1PPCAC_17824 [Pristionchus entomophagus]
MPSTLQRMRDRLGVRQDSNSPPLIRYGAERAIECSDDDGRSKASSRKRFTPVKKAHSTAGISNQSESSSSRENERDLLSIDSEYPLKTRYPLVNAVSREVRWFILDVIDAFERKEVSVVEGEDGELVKLYDPKTSLSVVQLRKDLKRLLSASRPLLEAAAAGLDLLMWVNPVATLLLVLVYMYSIWTGYVWALFFKLLLLQLTLNYFKAIHNVDIGLYFLPRKEIPMPKLDMSSGQLLIDLAKIAQWGVKFAADVLEKFESLFTWKRPDVTFHFYLLCVYWLMWSLCFSIGTCFGACGMTFGIRLFFTTYLFEKFPRLRYRLDTYGYFYRNLPIKSGDIATRPHSTDSRSFPSSSSTARKSDDNGNIRRHRSLDPINFSPRSTSISDIESIESLEEEDIIEDVLDHRRCIMIEKGSSNKASISGTLHLTPHALVFRSHLGEDERMIILEEIVSIRQVNGVRTLSILTGSRKGLEIELEDREKTSFIGISRRDEFFENIRQRSSPRTQFYMST